MIWLKRAGFILLTLLGLVFFIGTPWGTQLVLSIASGQLDGLEIEHDSGGLWGELVLTNVSFDDTSTKANVSNIKLDMGWRCLFKVEVCVESLSIAQIDVQLAPSPNNEPEEQTQAEKITLPVAINVNSLQLGSFNLAIKDSVNVEWQSLDIALQMHELLNIDRFLLQQPLVTLAQSEPAQTSNDFQIEDLTNWQYRPIDLPDLFIPLDANINHFRINQLAIKQQQELIQSIHAIDLQASVLDSHVAVERLNVDMPQGQLAFGAKITPSYQLDLLANWQSASQQQTPIEAKLTVNGNLADLNIEADVTGSIEANTQINANLTSEQLPLSVNAKWQAFAVPGQADIKVKPGELLLNGDMSEYRLAFDSGVNMNNAPETDARVRASGNLQKLTISQADLELLGGVIGFDGQIDVNQKALFNGNINIANIQPQQHWPEYESLINGKIKLHAEADTKYTLAQVTSLAINGDWLGYELGADGKLSYDSRSGVNIPQLAISTGDNTINLAGTFDNQQQLDLLLDGKLNALAHLYPELHGNIQIDSSVTGSPSTPKIDYKLIAKDIEYGNTSVDRIGASGLLIWDQEKPIDMTLSASQLVSNETQIESINLTLQGNAQSHRLVTSVRSNVVNIDAELSGQLQASSWQGHWQSGQFESQWGNYSLSEKTDIWADWQQQRYGISSHCWQDTAASLCVKQGQLQAQRVQFDIAGDELELLQILAAFIPQIEDISSDTRLSFNTHGDWLLDNAPQVSLKGKLSPSDIALRGKTEPLSMQQFNFGVELKGNDLTTDLTLKTQRSGNVLLTGKIREYAEAAILDVDMQFNKLLLQPYQELIPQLTELSGEINGNLNVSGDKLTPLINGELTVSNVNLAGEALPGRIDNWQQRVEFAGQEASFDGEFGFGNGRGQSTGFLDWSDVLIGELDLTGNQFELEYRDTVRARFSPDLQVNLLPDAIAIQGEVNLDYARIKVKELPPDAQSPSDDVVLVNAPTEQEELARPVNMLVQINIDPLKNDDVKLEAFGLKTDLQGELALKQEVGKLSGLGELRLVNGSYKAYGQDLIIRKGNIQFSGPLDSPSIDILAIRSPDKTQDDVIAGIKVFGQAEQPSVEIYSEPGMIQSRALSYLVQGKDLGAEGESQSVDGQMLASVLLSAGLKNSENKVDQLGRKFGIEDLAIDSEDGSKVSLSGYIAPGVQLKYGVNLFDSSSEVTLRYQLMPKLFLEAINSGAESSLELLYQFSLGKRESSPQQTSAN